MEHSADKKTDGGILTDTVNEVVWLPEELLEEAALTEVLSSRTEEVRIPCNSLFLPRHGLGFPGLLLLVVPVSPWFRMSKDMQDGETQNTS